MSRLAAPYLPRRPLETVLHRLVKEHGMEMLEHAEAEYEGPLPRYVVDEMLGYLACGDFSLGFVFSLGFTARYCDSQNYVCVVDRTVAGPGTYAAMFSTDTSSYPASDCCRVAVAAGAAFH